MWLSGPIAADADCCDYIGNGRLLVSDRKNIDIYALAVPNAYRIKRVFTGLASTNFGLTVDRTQFHHLGDEDNLFDGQKVWIIEGEEDGTRTFRILGWQTAETLVSNVSIAISASGTHRGLATDGRGPIIAEYRSLSAYINNWNINNDNIYQQTDSKVGSNQFNDLCYDGQYVWTIEQSGRISQWSWGRNSAPLLQTNFSITPPATLVARGITEDGHNLIVTFGTTDIG